MAGLALSGLEGVPAGASRVVAIANQKGGVGKTTTAVNLAACLAEAGERCLIVDLDPQANATSGLGLRANGHSTLDLLDGAPLSELALRSPLGNLDLVPAKPELAAARAFTVSGPNVGGQSRKTNRYGSVPSERASAR